MSTEDTTDVVQAELIPVHTSWFHGPSAAHASRIEQAVNGALEDVRAEAYAQGQQAGRQQVVDGNITDAEELEREAREEAQRAISALEAGQYVVAVAPTQKAAAAQAAASRLRNRANGRR